MFLTLHIPILFFLLFTWLTLPSFASTHGLQNAAAIQRENIEALRDKYLGIRSTDSTTEIHRHKKRESIIKFKNPRANQFHVDGTRIPDGTSPSESCIFIISTPFMFQSTSTPEIHGLD